jgi:hypothetical protein
MERYHYDKNRDTPWYVWLEFDRIIVGGANATVGIMRIKATGVPVVFKLSILPTHAIEHEHGVFMALKSSSARNAAFPTYIGTVVCRVGIDNVEDVRTGPFVGPNAPGVETRVLLMRFIPGFTVGASIYSGVGSGDIIRSPARYHAVIRHVIATLTIAYAKCALAHGDLHVNNVILRPCDHRLVILYVLNGVPYAVPTYGFIPTIVDFGQAHVGGVRTITTSLGHTHVGSNPLYPEPARDCHRFINGVLNALDTTHPSVGRSFRTTLRSVVRNDRLGRTGGRSITRRISHAIAPYADRRSNMFVVFSSACIDMLLGLVRTPTRRMPYRNAAYAYAAFTRQWAFVEAAIPHPMSLFRILRGVVEAVAGVSDMYRRVSTRVEAVATFRRVALRCVDHHAAFCDLTPVDWETMLCAMLELGTNIEGIVHQLLYDDVDFRRSEGGCGGIGEGVRDLMRDLMRDVDRAVRACDTHAYAPRDRILVYTDDAMHRSPKTFKPSVVMCDDINNNAVDASTALFRATLSSSK